MAPKPETRYARKGEISIAYQVIGDGPIDLVLVHGICAHMDLHWAVPGRWRVYAAVNDRPRDVRPVSSVDHEAAALTPGPRETMKPIDRAAVTLAKRAPSIGRLGFRLARPFRRRPG